MFRATFAVRLLNKGASLKDVAALLGNSVAIVSKHYAPGYKADRIGFRKSCAGHSESRRMGWASFCGRCGKPDRRVLVPAGHTDSLEMRRGKLRQIKPAVSKTA